MPFKSRALAFDDRLTNSASGPEYYTKYSTYNITENMFLVPEFQLMVGVKFVYSF